MNRPVLTWILAGVLLCGWVYAAESSVPPAEPPASAQPSSPPAPFLLEWVRLVPTDTVRKFYAAEEYIARGYKDYWRSKEVDEVMEKDLYKGVKPLVNDIVVREEPRDDAKSLGTIRSTIAKEVLSTTFQAEGSAEIVPFTPDLYVDGRLLNTAFCHDGHPYCHQTITARQGDWVRIPPHPWSKPGWINVKTSGLSIRPLGAGNNWSTEICPPYELDGRSLIVFGRTDTGLCVGPAGTSSINNFLQSREPFSADAYHEHANVAVGEIKWDKLVDSDGRLRLKLATKPELKENVKLLPHPNMGWIGLFDPDWERWISETEQDIIDVECKGLNGDQFQECLGRVIKDNKLEKKCELPVFEAPDPSSVRLGTITARARFDIYGASGEFRAEGSDNPVEFKPDESGRRLYTYGIQFHHTYLDKKGTWYKLPANPLPRPGWVDISCVTKNPSEKSEISGIFRCMKRSIIVLGIAEDGSGLCIRDENNSDYACGAEVDDAEITLDKVQVVRWKDLLDKDGHLLLQEEYTQGC